MGKWRGPRTASDPIYTAAAHRAARAYWKLVAAPCAICHRPIVYTANGTLDPWAFHLDHYPVSVAVGRERGWTSEQISALSNTRPTHRKCNIKHGARLGQKRQRVKAKRRKVLNTTRVW